MNVALVAIGFVGRATIVDVCSFLDLSDQRTAALAAYNHPAKSKITPHSTAFSHPALVVTFLNLVPQFLGHQRRADAFVESPLSHEPTRVDRVLRDGMECCREIAFTFEFKLLFHGSLADLFHRESPTLVPLRDPLDGRTGIRKEDPHV